MGSIISLFLREMPYGTPLKKDIRSKK